MPGVHPSYDCISCPHGCEWYWQWEHSENESYSTIGLVLSYRCRYHSPSTIKASSTWHVPNLIDGVPFLVRRISTPANSYVQTMVGTYVQPEIPTKQQASLRNGDLRTSDSSLHLGIIRTVPCTNPHRDPSKRTPHGSRATQSLHNYPSLQFSTPASIKASH